MWWGGRRHHRKSKAITPYPAPPPSSPEKPLGRHLVAKDITVIVHMPGNASLHRIFSLIFLWVTPNIYPCDDVPVFLWVTPNNNPCDALPILNSFLTTAIIPECYTVEASAALPPPLCFGSYRNSPMSRIDLREASHMSL